MRKGPLLEKCEIRDAGDDSWSVQSSDFLVVAKNGPTAVIAFREPGLRYYYPVPPANPPQVIEADVCVYGGTPGGVAAAVQAARMGKRAVLVVFRRHVGGMTSGGLTATDVGKRDAIGGLANEVYAKIGKTPAFGPRRRRRCFAPCSRTPTCRSTSSIGSRTW